VHRPIILKFWRFICAISLLFAAAQGLPACQTAAARTVPIGSDITAADVGLVADISSDVSAAFATSDAANPKGGDVQEPDTPSDSAVGSCPADQICPTTFSFSHDGNTAALPPGKLTAYSCKPSADESGPEQIYRVEVTGPAFLSAVVYPEAGVDVDVHILSALSAASCLDRGDDTAKSDVNTGVYFVVVDTYVSGGKALAGKYRVDIGLIAPSAGPCAMQTGTLARVKDGGKLLAMPATGPVVVEAHLVTQEEPPPYPTTATQELAAHKLLSQKKTGLVMKRTQVWAPLEGGGFYGAGIGSPTKFPVLDEGWYVNMYWTAAARPKAGTRMILRLPQSKRAVVVAAGYETGPGNLAHIGGTPEESHFYLGTGHLSILQLGFAVDNALPLGPRMCTD